MLFFKTLFRHKPAFFKIAFGGLMLSLCLVVYPQLYGDGYHALKELFSQHNAVIVSLLPIAGILILKPIITSVTLAAGGDGGVFAPSLFIGAFLGLLLANFANTFLHADVIPINFMVIGMAAVLSASIQAPFTALFLVCGMINNYTLFFPILIVCLVAKYTSKMIFPFTVYTYSSTSLK